jgi:hypothetical protein
VTQFVSNLSSLKNNRSYHQVLVIAALIFSSSFLTLEIGGGLTAADLVLVPIAVLGIVAIHRANRDTEKFLLLFSLCVFFIFLGSLLAVIDDGLLNPDAITLVQDGYIFFLFVGLSVASCLLGVTRSHVEYGSLLALIAVVVHLAITTDNYRSSALFGNPNLAAHFVMVLGIIGISSRTRAVKVGATMFALAGLALAGSFSAIVGLSVAIAYQFLSWIWSKPQRPAWMGGLIIAGATALTLVLSGSLTTALPDVELSSSLNSDRFSRSGGLREQIWAAGIDAWQQDLLGIGPQGFKRKSVFIVRNEDGVGGTEIHSDILGYLVERGPIALVGLLGFCLLLWSRGGRGGPTRTLLMAWSATAMTRETLHFRHLWIGFALALVADGAIRLRDSDGLVPAKVTHRLTRRPRPMVVS